MSPQSPSPQPPVPSPVAAGAGCASPSAPILNGTITTITANGADNRKKSHSEVSPTTRIPAIFSAAQVITTNSPA